MLFLFVVRWIRKISLRFECNLFTIKDIHLHKQTHRFFFRHHETQQFAAEQYH
jgi:hypothetical protein